MLVEGLVPGVVVGGVWWSSLKQIASPQPGMVPVAWWVWLAWYQAFSRAASVGMVARIGRILGVVATRVMP